MATARARASLARKLVAISAVSTLLAASASARAATFTATDTASFVNAVAMANSASGDSTITVASGTYAPKQTVELSATGNTITIQGPVPAATATTIPAKFIGGAIVPTGATLFKVDAGVTVDFNAIDATNAGSTGNPAFDVFGTAHVAQSSIAAVGPGLDVESGASATVVNSTISDGLDFGIIDTGTLSVTNSTIARNPNGGIDNANGTLHLTNSIVAKNGTPDCTAAANSSDKSLDGDGTCGVGTLSSKNPMLGAINLNGGSTPTDAPAAGSPALDAGDTAACPAVDQRGAPRPDDAGTACDIGAVERYAAPPALNASNVTTTTASPAGTAVTYTATFTDAGAPIKTQSCSPPSGSTFPIGATTVNCTATDGFGNTGTGSFTVTVTQVVNDKPPVITAPTSPVTAAATGANGAIVTFTVTAMDAAGPVAVTCTPASGSQFALGATTVNCASTNVNGTTNASFTVTVTDQAPPVITVPNNVTAVASSASGAVVTYTQPTATDNVDGAVAASCSPASGSTFPIGPTTVTCTATDKAGNHGSNTFTVTVVQDTPPVLTTPGDQTAAATSAAGAAVSFSVTATDARGGSVPVACTPASGSTFPVGSTTVGCSATDTAGAVGNASFMVTVVDRSLPVVTVPANISVAASGPSGAVVTYTATATDLVDGALTPTCQPASGATFPVGQTIVNCSATDKARNIGQASFQVTVTDPAAPVLALPPAKTVAASSPSGAVVTFTATASELVDGSDPVICTPPSGATFPVGTTTVNCSATSKAGAATTGSFAITVSPYVPPGPPVITVPPDRTVGADTASGVVVTYTVTATDKVDGAVTPTCTPASGTVFPVGTTTVTCTARDAAGRSATKTFAVIVDPPVLPTHAKVSSVSTSARAATVVLACTGPADETCDVTVALLAASASGARASAKHGGVIVTTDVSIVGGKKKKVILKLSRGSLAKLGQRRTLTVFLALTQAAADGTPTTTTRRLVFRVAGAAAAAPGKPAKTTPTIRFTG